MIKRKIIASIDQISHPPVDHAPKVLLYLFDSKLHELSFLLCHFLLKKRGFEVINIGVEVHSEEVIDAYNIHHPEFILNFYSNHIPISHYSRLLEKIGKACTESELILTGLQRDISIPSMDIRVRQLGTLQETLSFMEEHTPHRPA